MIWDLIRSLPMITLNKTYSFQILVVRSSMAAGHLLVSDTRWKYGSPQAGWLYRQLQHRKHISRWLTSTGPDDSTLLCEYHKLGVALFSVIPETGICMRQSIFFFSFKADPGSNFRSCGISDLANIFVYDTHNDLRNLSCNTDDCWNMNMMTEAGFCFSQCLWIFRDVLG